MAVQSTIERAKLLSDSRQFDEPVHTSKKVILRDMILNRELIEQRPLCLLPWPHHRSFSPISTGIKSATSVSIKREFFNGIRPKRRSTLKKSGRQRERMLLKSWQYRSAFGNQNLGPTDGFGLWPSWACSRLMTLKTACLSRNRANLSPSRPDGAHRLQLRAFPDQVGCAGRSVRRTRFPCAPC